jgi:excinuclease UvrABC nuclease subunit
MMEIHKFNYEDLRVMSMEEMFEKSSLYDSDELLDAGINAIPTNGRGVYILYSLTGKKLYVGKSENIRKRVRRHLKGEEKITREYIPFVSSVRVFYVTEEVGRQNLYSVERWFINQLKPTFNNS